MNLEMALVDGGFRLILLVVELWSRSRLEEVLDDKAEDPGKEYQREEEAEEKEAVDEDDEDEEFEDNRLTNSTNESRYSNCSIGSNRYHFFAILSSNVNGVSGISSFKSKLPPVICRTFNFSFSYLVKISKDS